MQMYEYNLDFQRKNKEKQTLSVEKHVKNHVADSVFQEESFDDNVFFS